MARRGWLLLHAHSTRVPHAVVRALPPETLSVPSRRPPLPVVDSLLWSYLQQITLPFWRASRS